MPDQIAVSPWADLAVQARALADLADQLAGRDPADLAPDEGGDPLASLDKRALDLVGAAAACRRATWQSLRDGGMTFAAIGRLFPRDGKPRTISTIRNALVAQDRAR
ncbi:hypothetical protein ACFWPK_04185 [Nocardia sp. NPDC058519]|uniref:hypothetical protein n=1 Tax=Nocardia sp. NPDC058519 TaxID=3346535 RepID=UPI00365E74B3